MRAGPSVGLLSLGAPRQPPPPPLPPPSSHSHSHSQFHRSASLLTRVCDVSGECAKDKEPIPGGSTRGAAHDNWQMDWHVYRSHVIILHTANMCPSHPAVTLSAAWLNNSISYYLDGRLYHTVQSSAALFPTAPMHVIFDQVCAGSKTPFWPQHRQAVAARCQAAPHASHPLTRPLTRSCSPPTAATTMRTRARACRCAWHGCAHTRWRDGAAEYFIRRGGGSCGRRKSDFSNVIYG
jgi:hypothetical protein